MANPITKIENDILGSTLRVLGKAGATTDHSDWMRGCGNAALLIQFIDEQRGLSEENPYEISVEDSLSALRRAFFEEEPDWGTLEDEVVDRLRGTAPAWPKGRHAYRSFRIRFGEREDGVKVTFERHAARIERVFGAKHYWRWEALKSGEYRLRLLNGNHTHKPVIEWVIVDLGTNRERNSVTAVRGPESLADELLVIAWLFPDMIRAIDGDKLPGLFAAGYEVNIPGSGVRPWQSVVIVGFGRDKRQVSVYAHGRGHNRPDYSVPVVLE